MTVRAVVLGLLLGLSVSAVAYFNSFVIVQALLINHLLPIVILGAVLLILLVINPLLVLVSGGRGFSTREVAVVAALGLVACAYPEAGFYLTGPTNVAMPAYQYPSIATWQADDVRAYVPGGPAFLGEGHVQDWPELAQQLMEAGDHARRSVLGLLWEQLPLSARREFEQVAEDRQVVSQQRRTLTRALNQALNDARLQHADNLEALAPPPQAAAQATMSTAELSQDQQLALNRALLVAASPQVVLPPPAGEGALLLGGRMDPQVTGPLRRGPAQGERLALTELPWSAWWPSIRLWGGSALLIGLATLCLALVVHPQWSRNEQLPYPIARFVNEMAHREPGRYLPQVTMSRMFWWGFTAMVLLHLINGLGEWYGTPSIARRIDLTGLSVLFPDASRIYGAGAYLFPTLFFTAAAFAFLLPAQVSFSLGVASLLYVLLGAALLKAGVTLQSEYLGAGPPNMLRFGGYVGMAMMILYTGRFHYRQVLAGAVGLRVATPAPRSAVWAARGFVLAALAATAVLTTGGLHWTFALAAVALILLIFLVAARIVAETGMFFIQPWWMPVAVLTALMGFEALGPTTYVVLALASTMIVGDTRTALMANAVNALQIVDRSGEKPGRAAPWLMTMVVAGFLVAGAATMYVAYNFDAFARADEFTRDALPAMPFDHLAQLLADASATDRITQATALSGSQRWLSARPDPGLLGWTGLGLALVLVTAAARLRLPWWPLHPVAFLIWGTYPANRFAFSFLVGWVLKMMVTRLGGSRAYHALVPLMVGIVAGEVAISFFWLAAGAIYYFSTGMNQSWYSVI